MKTSKNYLIGIHSYKRGDWLLKHTNSLSFMSENIISNTKLFIRREEYENYFDVINKYGVDFECIDVPKESYVALTKDIMIDHIIAKGCTYCILLDDDMKFDIRPHLDTKYRRQTKEIFEKMIEDIISICDNEYPITGVAMRQFSNNFNTPYSENKKIIQLVCLHLPTISKDRVYYNGLNISCMSDYYFLLSYLEKGYKNKTINMYVRNDKFQTEGGCAAYRTAKMISDSAVKIYKTFPKYISLSYKNTGAWKEKRIALRVQWKKAFNKEKYEERKKVV